MAAARGLAGRLCATPVSLATSTPRRTRRNVGTVSTPNRSNDASSIASTSTVTNATSANDALRWQNVGWKRTHGAHQAAVNATHARGHAAVAARSASKSEHAVGAAASLVRNPPPPPPLMGFRSPSRRLRTSHPNAPDLDTPRHTASIPPPPIDRRGAAGTGASHHAGGDGDGDGGGAQEVGTAGFIFVLYILPGCGLFASRAEGRPVGIEDGRRGREMKRRRGEVRRAEPAAR